MTQQEALAKKYGFPSHYAPPDLIRHGIAWRAGQKVWVLLNDRNHSMGAWADERVPLQLWSQMAAGKLLICRDYSALGPKKYRWHVMRKVESEEIKGRILPHATGRDPLCSECYPADLYLDADHREKEAQ